MSEQTGVIHDIGYQRYSGQRLGRRHIVGALYLHGLRAAFGLGRSASDARSRAEVRGRPLIRPRCVTSSAADRSGGRQSCSGM